VGNYSICQDLAFLASGLLNEASYSMRLFKQKLAAATVAIAVALLACAPAHASLLNPDGILVTDGPDSPSFFNTLEGTSDIILLYKAEFDDGVPGDVEGDFGEFFTIVHPVGGSDEDATISWDLTGSGFLLSYVAWKDGTIAGQPGTGTAFLYSGVSEDQRLIGGPHDITTTGPFVGAFSHIAFYGRPGEVPPVPDGGATVMLLGTALACLGALRRRFV
jgi:VPDSG-CTERM motif